MPRRDADDRYDDEIDEYDDEVAEAPRRKPRRRQEPSKRVTAGILGILLGGFGVHKFYLGYTVPGIILLVASIFTCGAAGVIGLAEGIIYLTKTDDEFYETYQAGKKEWF